MAKPRVIEIPENTVVKVGDGINILTLQKMQTNKKYYQTYRDHSDLDIPEINSNEWLEIADNVFRFESENLTDVYIYCDSGTPGINGFLRDGAIIGPGFNMAAEQDFSIPFELAVSKGLVPGHSIIDKFGVNDIITPTSNPEDIVESGGIYPDDDFGTAPITSIASTSPLDVGVQVEIILGLDINGDKISNTYTLEGTDRVALTTPLWKSLSAEVVGDQAPSGDIFIYTGVGPVPSLGDSEIRAYINSDDRRTNIGYVTIPNKKVGFLYRGELGIELDSSPSSGGEYARCRYISKRVDGLFTTKKNITLISNGGSIYSDSRPFPDPIPGLSSLKINVKEVSVDMGVWGTMIVLLIDENLFPDSYLKAIGQPGY